MLNLKKLVASICVIALTISTVAFGASYTDVTVDSAYYEAVETLSKLEIVTGYEDGTYKPEETVTRAEMAALIARIQGFDETAKAGADTIFTDVPKSHWASGYVAQAANQGIINGFGDGTFGPEDAVTYEQAVKMIMATLGYTPFADHNGGYPTGYLTAATRYNVTKGVANAVVGSGANRGTIAQLLNNAIDTPLMIQSAWTTNGEVTYVVCDGSEKVDGIYRTLMSEYLGVIKLKGVVTENSILNVEGSKIINTEALAEVTIDLTDNFDTNHKDFQEPLSAESFLVGESDAESYIGKAVIFYVIENTEEDEWEIVSIAEDTARNDVLEIDLALFKGINGNEIEYYKAADTNDTTEALCEADVDVVLNNKALGSGLSKLPGDFTEVNLKKRSGKIILIDNDTTKGADVAFVEVAATAVVKNASEEGVNFKKAAKLFGGDDLSAIEIDAEDETKVVEIYKDGEVVAPETLVEWDVLTILAYNEGADYIVAEVVSNPVVGVVEASFDSDISAKSNTGYKVEGVKYAVALNAFGMNDIEVGAGGTFYIDKYGKIAAFNEDAALATGVSGDYAFVLKAIAENDPMDGATVKLQVLTANGVETLNMAARATLKAPAIGGGAALYDGDIKLTDVSFGGGATAESAATAYFQTRVLKGTVIEYTKNSSNEITGVKLAGFDEKFESNGANTAGVAFDADNNKLGKYIDADATIFFVDFAKTAGGSRTSEYDKNKCQVGTIADFEDEETYGATAAGDIAYYATNKAEDNDIVVVVDGLGKAGSTSSVAVVSDVYDSKNDEGDTIKTITYLIDGAEVTADTVALSDIATNISTLTAGDIIKVKVGGAGLITDIDFVWNFKKGVKGSNVVDYQTSPSYDTTINATGEDFYGGYVKFYKESSEQATIASLSTPVKLSKAKNVIVVDPTGKTVSVKAGGSFRVYDALYSDKYLASGVVGTDATTYLNMNNVGDGRFDTFAQKYVDYIFVRFYDGDVEDVVIVRAPKDDIKVKEGAEKTASLYTVTYSAGSTGETVPAAVANIADGTNYTLAAAPAGFHWEVGGETVTRVTVTANVTVTLVADAPSA